MKEILACGVDGHYDVGEIFVTNRAQQTRGVHGVGLEHHVGGFDDLQRFPQVANVERIKSGTPSTEASTMTSDEPVCSERAEISSRELLSPSISG